MDARRKIVAGCGGIVLVLGGVWFWAESAPGGVARTVEIPLGETRAKIAGRLAAAGVVRSRRAFLLRASLDRGTLHAGEYEFAPTDRPRDVFAKLRAGRVRLHAFTVPEGWDTDQIAAALQAKGLGTAEAFRAAAADPILLQRHGIRAANAEGHLFPDTYRVPRGMDERRLVRMMLARFDEQVPDELRAKAAGRGLTFPQALALASIVEHETARADERPRVAAVFHNRRARKMRLESCATVWYALKRAGRPVPGERLTGGGVPVREGRLKLSDLDVVSPYNTYRRAGIPPGPIGNPGLASIQAALAPADTDDLFFVARGDGGHDFASSYEEFLKEKRTNRRRAKVSPRG